MSEVFEVNKDLRQGDSLSLTLFNIKLEKAIRKMQRKTTGVTIGQNHIVVLGFVDNLNVLESLLEDIERAGHILEQTASKKG